MKIAVSSYVVTQTSLIVAWVIGLFNMSLVLAFIPTLVVVALLAILFGILKLVEHFIDMTDEDEDFSEVLGLADGALEEEVKEESAHGQNQNQEGQHT